MSEQAKHTEAEYAESAKKYGHSCGPFEFNGYRYVRNAAGNNVCQLGDVGATVASEQENTGNGKLFAQAPDLLLERDRQAGQIRRLTRALNSMRTAVQSQELVKGYERKGDYIPPSMQAAYDEATAALAEGGAA